MGEPRIEPASQGVVGPALGVLVVGRAALAPPVYLYVDAHSKKVPRKSDPGATYGGCQAGVPRYADANQISAVNQVVGWIEGNPPGARQIDLYPRMGGAGCGNRQRAVVKPWGVQIARNKPRSLTKVARCFDHQRSKITAGAASEFQRAMRCLDTFLEPWQILHAATDELRHVHQ